MSVRQTPLLKLNDPREANNLAQDVLFEKIVYESIEFDLENTDCQIRTIIGSLKRESRKENQVHPM